MLVGFLKVVTMETAQSHRRNALHLHLTENGFIGMLSSPCTSNKGSIYRVAQKECNDFDP